MDKVLVIVVTYNAHVWVRNCLSSIDLEKYDVLVVDNRSQDDTVKIINDEFPDVELICSCYNLGFGKANNIGFQKALDEGYDYVLLLNQDAWLKEDTIACLIKEMKNNREFGIISPLQCNSTENNIETQFNKYLVKNKIDINGGKVQEVDFVNAAIWLIPRKTLEFVGGFNPIYPHYGEDSDYVNRVRYWGKKIGVAVSVIAYHDRPATPKVNTRQQIISEYRLRISFLVLANDINHSLKKELKLIRKIVVVKILKFALYCNFKQVKNYLLSYKGLKKTIEDVKSSRRMSLYKKAYLK